MFNLSRVKFHSLKLHRLRLHRLGFSDGLSLGVGDGVKVKLYTPLGVVKNDLKYNFTILTSGQGIYIKNVIRHLYLPEPNSLSFYTLDDKNIKKPVLYYG